jgi:hypothetical protein
LIPYTKRTAAGGKTTVYVHRNRIPYGKNVLK